MALRRRNTKLPSAEIAAHVEIPSAARGIEDYGGFLCASATGTVLPITERRGLDNQRVDLRADCRKPTHIIDGSGKRDCRWRIVGHQAVCPLNLPPVDH